jgi:hypothetical protein
MSTSKVVMITKLMVMLDTNIELKIHSPVSTEPCGEVNVCTSIVINDDADAVVNALLVVFT